METNGLQLTLGGLTALLGLCASVSGLWRFFLKPIIDGMKEEQARTDTWRNETNIRVTLLEHFAPEEAIKLRKELLS